ncbi:MAG: S8 family peptidase [Bdellovibrionota bacterium]
MSFSWKVMSYLLVVSLPGAVLASDYKPGEVIVKYKDDVSRTRTIMTKLYDDVGVKKIRRYSGIMRGFEQYELDENVKVQDAVAELLKNDAVEYAQPNYILRTFPVNPVPYNNPRIAMPCIPGMDVPGCDPNEKIPCLVPGIPFPPGCEDSGGGNPGGDDPPSGRPALNPAPPEVNPSVEDPDISKAWGLEKIEATKAWREHMGSKDFIVADIDTGIDYNHEDLSFNLWRNPNPSDKNDVVGFNFVHNDGLPYDDNEHGTHTAGTIGATGGDGKGISGVSQRVSLMTLKFLAGDGSGTTADAIRAIDYAVAHGAKVLSNSWGGKGDDDNKALYDAIERARDKNVLFIAAAGNDGADNDGKDASYPAAFDNDNLISVAATDRSDQLAFFSNYGKKTTHLAAPGANVYSTIPGGKYASFSGTSMACPHVAGAAAMVWSKHPDWDYKHVKKVLMESVDQLPSLSGKIVTGGRLNVLKALRSME